MTLLTCLSVNLYVVCRRVSLPVFACLCNQTAVGRFEVSRCCLFSWACSAIKQLRGTLFFPVAELRSSLLLSHTTYPVFFFPSCLLYALTQKHSQWISVTNVCVICWLGDKEVKHTADYWHLRWLVVSVNSGIPRGFPWTEIKARKIRFMQNKKNRGNLYYKYVLIISPKDSILSNAERCYKILHAMLQNLSRWAQI